MANIFTGKRLQELGILAIFVVALQVLLSKFVYPLFGAKINSLYVGLAPNAIGDKLIGFLSGIVPFSIGSLQVWLSMFVGVLVLLLAGFFIYEQGWAYKGRNMYTRLAAILAYSSFALYFVLLVTTWGGLSVVAVPLLIGVAINYILLAVILGYLSKYVKALRI